MDVCFRYAAPCEIDAVRHYTPVALIAERAQVLPRSMADCPDLIEGADIVNKQLFCALLQKLRMDGICNVNIELGVIGKNRWNMDPGAQFACKHGRGNGAMAVDEIKRVFHKCLHGLL